MADSLSDDVEPNTVAKAAGIDHFQGLCTRFQRHRDPVPVYGSAQEPAIHVPEQRTLPVSMSRSKDNFLPLAVEVPTKL